MCGISGIFHTQIEETLHNMSALLEHRGPDLNLDLLHNRLSIIDLSQEHQLMQDSSEGNIKV